MLIIIIILWFIGGLLFTLPSIYSIYEKNNKEYVEVGDVVCCLVLTLLGPIPIILVIMLICIDIWDRLSHYKIRLRKPKNASVETKDA